MRHFTPARRGCEQDVVQSKLLYCYLTRAGVSSSIKLQMRRRERRYLKKQSKQQVREATDE